MATTKSMLNAPSALLRDELSYEADTGVFRWKTDRIGKTKGGDVAGCINDGGYRILRFGNVIYRAHRLAWWFVHGEMPSGVIDHINGVTTDNRIANLRVASFRTNAQNVHKAKAGSRTGLLGVCAPSDRKCFTASIRDNQGRKLHLGTFVTPEDAHAAYMAAKRRMHDAPFAKSIGQCV
jgi:hypothetical protein